MRPTQVFALALAAALAGLSACTHLPAARMALPATLEAVAPVTLTGLGAGRSGNFVLEEAAGSFERGRDRLSIFNALSFDKASVRYQLRLPPGRTVQAACLGRQTEARLGLVQLQARPYQLSCEWTGALPARMTLSAPGVVPGTRAERQGEFEAGDIRLALRSVHAVQGSPLPLEAPIGYLISRGGEPVGAVEINGTEPRLWLPAAGHPLREPVLMAALAVAVLWDPAGGLP